MYLIPKIDIIKSKMKESGYNAHSLAKAAGLDKKAIYRILNQESSRTHSLRANAIAGVLNCPVEELFEKPARGQ